MNLIAYRLPGNAEPVIYEAGRSEKASFEPGEDSFIVSPFDTSLPLRKYTLTRRLDRIPEDIVITNHTKRRCEEAGPEEYRNYIDIIKREIGDDETKKIVASRRKTVTFDGNVSTLFNRLCERYPEAFVFFISVPEFGSWIGASPELLLEKKADELVTMSLAGTRQAGSTCKWDEKNLKEQHIVTRFITRIFEEHGLEPTTAEDGTAGAGEIEHLRTIIRSKTKKDLDVISLLRDLAPTPALSGYPKREAMEIIRKQEDDRSLYGGFMGPLFASGDFRLNVTLRCAFLSPTSATLFAGGGITCYSDAETEWLETEKKLDTIRRIL